MSTVLLSQRSKYLEKEHCMVRQVMRNPFARLLLVIAAILCNDHSSTYAQAQLSVRQTPALVFSTYLGGSTPCDSCSGANTFAQNTTVDTEGNIYVTGATTVSDLPVLNASQQQPAQGSTMSAFVAKYDPNGNPLWCTYLGGNNQSMGVGIAAMFNGGVAVAGLTTSNTSVPFPTMNPYQLKLAGKSDYFLTVFDGSGSMLYSTYLGGSGTEGTPEPNTFAYDSNNGNNVAVDAQGLVYVTGITSSGDFPVTPVNAVQPALAGGKDAFLSIIDPTKSGKGSLVYSSFLGGTGDDKGHGVAVDSTGSLITIVGFTASTDFPTTANGYQPKSPAPNFTSNGYVAQFTSSQPGQQSSQYTKNYCTYLGGQTDAARDDAYGVAIDPQGLILVTGRTQSYDFPMNGPSVPSIYNSAPYLAQSSSNDEPYLVKIDPTIPGTASLAYATFLGAGSTNGTGGAFCTSVAVDSKGTVYVGGETNNTGVFTYTYSPTPQTAPTEFPHTADALFTALQGNFDAILMQISPDGTTLGYSTYIGGTDGDRTYGLAVDTTGNVVQAGPTYSSDFPLKNPAQTWPGNVGGLNAFVLKFSFVPTLTVTKSGSGSGRVVSSLSGIDCGPTCRAGFKKNARVVLTPVPDSGSVFTGWTGACKGHGQCSVVMRTDITVGAVFETGSCSYTILPSRRTLSHRGGEITLWVMAKDYSFCRVPEIVNHTDWITCTETAFTRNRGSVKLSVPKYDNRTERTGTLTVGGKTFTVIQRGRP
jgi:hypothetical protein